MGRLCELTKQQRPASPSPALTNDFAGLIHVFERVVFLSRG
jgi:hypothetical protein